MIFAPIHHTFAPHVTWHYVLRCWKLLWTPWRWKHGGEIARLQQELKRRYGGDVRLTASGREALLMLLKTMKISPGDEIIVQGYTCIVVPNAIHAAGAVPVYADIDPDTLNLTPETVKSVLTEKTKAVICQHTFGIPSPLKELRTLCDERDIVLIEDCAHILPDAKGPHDIARTGSAVIASFGRDKAVSGVSGGAVIVHDQAIAHALPSQESLPSLGIIAIKRFLLYPIIYAKARLLYGIGIGKLLLWLSRKIGTLPSILTLREKRGEMDDVIHAMPNALASLAYHELTRLEEINDHRRELTRCYLHEARKRSWPMLAGIDASLPLQKYPMFIAHANAIRTQLKKHNIHLHDGWTGCVICPESCDQKAAGYSEGSDMAAEKAALQIFSLPTHPTMTMARAPYLCDTFDEVRGQIG